MNLSLGFPEPAQERIVARQTGLAGAIARFQEWMAHPDSPVRAVRHQPARAGEFAPFPEALVDPLKQALVKRGVYGSHLANVIRRLKRICEFYRSSPQFICCSATIANPKELAESLTGLPFELVDRNGAPSGDKYVVFYNPPVVNRQLGIRRSYLNETRRIARELLERGQQTLVFANSRLATELLLTYLKEDYPGDDRGVRGYRGGYLPKERREIERKLRDGDIRAVVATNALELGIDIGSLDAVVMAGYPGTIASTWQRAGRAGRRQTASLAVLVAARAPLYSYIIGPPEYFFERP